MRSAGRDTGQMTGTPLKPRRARTDRDRYVLDSQIGFLFRQVSQRHSAIFVARMGEELTPTQWAALAKLEEIGAVSQNQLGRLTAMDGATIKGVIARLLRRDLVSTEQDTEDGRRLVIALTPAGRAMVAKLTGRALQVSDETLSPLERPEREQLFTLLKRLR